MHDMRMRENELVRVFDHDESLVVRNRRGEGAEKRALARSGGTAHEDVRALAETVPRAVDEDVGHQGIVEQLLERSETEKLRTHRIELRLGEGRARRGPDALAEKSAPCGLGIDRQESRGVDPCGNLGTHPS